MWRPVALICLLPGECCKHVVDRLFPRSSASRRTFAAKVAKRSSAFSLGSAATTSLVNFIIRSSVPIRAFTAKVVKRSSVFSGECCKHVVDRLFPRSSASRRTFAAKVAKRSSAFPLGGAYTLPRRWPGSSSMHRRVQHTCLQQSELPHTLPLLWRQ